MKTEQQFKKISVSLPSGMVSWLKEKAKEGMVSVSRLIQDALRVQITPEQTDAFNSACNKAQVSASTVIRDLCQAVVPYIKENCIKDGWRKPKLVDETAHSWGIIELQIILDHAKTVDEVKDLVYTVLERNLITWDSPIPTDRNGYLDMVKQATKARLKELREVKK